MEPASSTPAPKGPMASATPTQSATGTQALDRAAQLVTTVVHADEPISFSQITRECDLPKSTASRLLTALERTELLERHDDGGYVAGPLFWLYATRHDPWEELVRLAHPVLEKVGELTGETVHLGVTRNGRVAHVDQVDSAYLLGSRDWTDVDVPTHLSALGQVLIAYDALPAPVGRLERADGSPYPRKQLAETLPGIRERGVAVTLDDLEPGLSAVAAPVRGGDGAVFGALGISGPTSRLEDRIPEISGLLIDHADTLSATLRRRRHKEGAA